MREAKTEGKSHKVCIFLKKNLGSYPWLVQERDIRVLVLPSNRVTILWREIREWRQHWDVKTFFTAVLFSFIFSLHDKGTDFNFAWSVPTDCPEWRNLSQIDAVMMGPCGLVKAKNAAHLLLHCGAWSPSWVLFFSLRSCQSCALQKITQNCQNPW